MGEFDVGSVVGQDEDLLRFVPTSIGDNTAGSFSLYFDGSDVAMDDKKEDVSAVASDGTDVYLSTIDTFNAGGVTAEAEDVVSFSGVFGSATSGVFGLHWDGSSEGVASSVVGLDLA